MIRRAWDHLLSYAVKFGLVGLAGMVVDVALFNVLRLGMLGPALAAPLVAKALSVAVAIVITWFGNRLWTFRAHRRKNLCLEFAEFVVIALIGMGIALACLWVSHYVLGFTSLAADNIAANVVGLGLGTVFRFFAYRYWVFAEHRAGRVHALVETAEA